MQPLRRYFTLWVFTSLLPATESISVHFFFLSISGKWIRETLHRLGVLKPNFYSRKRHRLITRGLSSFPPLVTTIEHICSNEHGSKPMVLYSFKLRPGMSSILFRGADLGCPSDFRDHLFIFSCHVACFLYKLWNTLSYSASPSCQTMSFWDT